MKPVKKAKKLLARFDIEVNGQQDRAVLSELVEVQAKCKKTESALPVFDIFRIIIRSRMIQAVAATIIIGIGFFSVYEWGERDAIVSKPIPQEVKSPADLTTLGALRFAFCQGGMEKVEQMCDQAISMSGPRPAEISRWDCF